MIITIFRASHEIKKSVTTSRVAKVFLSYRHEDDAFHPDHQSRVKELGLILRAAKLDVRLDQFFNEEHPGGPDEQWPKWCENQVPDADKVLMIASHGYFRCYNKTESPGIGLGAACETTVICNLLYECGYVSDKFRIVYFEKAHLTELHPALSGIHRFDGSNQASLTELIAWLGGNIPIAATQAALPATWPGMLAEYEPDLANRSDEFAFFSGMISNRTTEKALLLEAPSNYGKTSLVAECMKYARIAIGNVVCVTVDFKSNPSKEYVIDTLRLELGLLLPNFGKANGTIFNFRSDLRTISVPLILLFDTYEKASIEAQQFVEGLLLADLKSLPAVRIVIAGQNIPDHTKFIWRTEAKSFRLGPITNPSHWCAYAERHFRDFKPETIEALTIVAVGIPGVLRPMLQLVFPQKNSKA